MWNFIATNHGPCTEEWTKGESLCLEELLDHGGLNSCLQSSDLMIDKVRKGGKCNKVEKGFGFSGKDISVWFLPSHNKKAICVKR